MSKSLYQNGIMKEMNMKLKYLLTMYCEEQGYWDTSGYCHWREKAFHNREEFDLDDEEGLIKAIASFVEEYPKGEYEIYVIQPDEEHENKMANIRKESINLAEKIKQEKRLKK